LNMSINKAGVLILCHVFSLVDYPCLSYIELKNISLSDLLYHIYCEICFDVRFNCDRNVRVRLDRVVASQQWSLWFQEASVKHIISSRADHCPILLNAENELRGRDQHRGFQDMKSCGKEKNPCRTKLRRLVSQGRLKLTLGILQTLYNRL
jgi:hypothetical protein